MKRQTYFLLALLFLTICVSPVAASPATRYTVTDIGTLGGSFANAFGINNAGVVVGYSETTYKTLSLTSYVYETHAFSWQAGRMRDLGTLGGGFSDAKAVNDRGEIVGYSELKAPGREATHYGRAFLYSYGKMHDLGTLPGTTSSGATGINSEGKIVGVAGTNHVSQGGVADELAVIWSGGNVRAINEAPSEAYGINREGWISGKALTEYFHPILWSPANKEIDLLTVPGLGMARAVNSQGEVVGNRGGMEGYPRHAFLWQLEGQDKELPALPGHTACDAEAINNREEVVGVSAQDYNAWGYVMSNHMSYPGQAAACRWKNGAVENLNALIPPDAGWTLWEATGINDRGQICGNGTHHGQSRAFLLTPLPDKL